MLSFRSYDNRFLDLTILAALVLSAVAIPVHILSTLVVIDEILFEGTVISLGQTTSGSTSAAPNNLEYLQFKPVSWWYPVLAEAVEIYLQH